VVETEKKADFLFYAALEFRNCIERTLFEYLYLVGSENWVSTWEKEYRATRLKDIILRIEPEFYRKLQFANLHMKALGFPEIFILNLEILSELYGKLGNYLHSSKSPDKTSESTDWWEKLYVLANDVKQTLNPMFASPIGFLRLNEKGWQLYIRWRDEEVTDNQVIDEFRKATLRQSD